MQGCQICLLPRDLAKPEPAVQAFALPREFFKAQFAVICYDGRVERGENRGQCNK